MDALGYNGFLCQKTESIWFFCRLPGKQLLYPYGMITGTGGGVDYGWGWYYPYYPPVYVTSYTTGTLIMNLMDKAVVSANGNLVLQWTGAVNGVMNYTYDATRVNAAIDKAFDQSPYLKIK